MMKVLEGPVARLPQVPDLPTLLTLARGAGASSESEALRLVAAGLQLLSRTWSDAVRIRLVAAAPVDVARWLAAPMGPSRSGGSVDADPVGMLVESAGCSPAVAEAVLAALVGAFSDLLPVAARSAGASGR